MYQADLKIIAKHAEERERENYDFRSWLKMKDGEALDRVVHEINAKVSAGIDCTKCGNCCKTMGTDVTAKEITTISNHFNQTEEEFIDKYLERNEEGNYGIDARPCHFFDGRLCSIYDIRPQECKDFPHLHKPGFQQRLLSVVWNYGQCPIVYNVFEELKQRLGYRVKGNRKINF